MRLVCHGAGGVIPARGAEERPARRDYGPVAEEGRAEGDVVRRYFADSQLFEDAAAVDVLEEVEGRPVGDGLPEGTS